MESRFLESPRETQLVQEIAGACEKVMVTLQYSAVERETTFSWSHSTVTKSRVSEIGISQKCPIKISSSAVKEDLPREIQENKMKTNSTFIAMNSKGTQSPLLLIHVQYMF